MKHFVKIGALIFAALLSSCEGNTDRTWQVSNSSSSTIEVYANAVGSNSEMVTTVQVNATETVGTSTQLGGNATEQFPEEMFDDLFIVNVNGDTVQRGFIDPGNWESVVEQIKKVPSMYEHTYTFRVTDSDF